MKKVTIEIPNDKKIEIKDGKITLVPDTSVMERIKTFKDAYNELGHNHPLCEEYYQIINLDCKVSKELIAYLKLRIITAALTNKWNPSFTVGEKRYYPWFWLYTKEEYDNMNNKDKQDNILRSDYDPNADYSLVYVYTHYDDSHSYGFYGSQLVFETKELAEYAGKQFIDIYKDFIFGNELYTHN